MKIRLIVREMQGKGGDSNVLAVKSFSVRWDCLSLFLVSRVSPFSSFSVSFSLFPSSSARERISSRDVD